jgi:hypothetical protein
VSLLRAITVADGYQAPAPASGASDDFNRANAATLNTSSSGHTWAVTAGTWNVASNQGHPPLALTDYRAATLDGGLVDATIECTFNAPVGLNFDGGLVGRFVDINNFIFLDISLVGSSFLTRTFQRVGGSFSGLTSLVNPVSGIVPGTPFTAKMVLTGSSGESFINNVSMGAFSGVDSGLLASDLHGVVFSSTDSVTPPDFDNFSIA